jgi:putative sigma-54 modulation protein
MKLIISGRHVNVTDAMREHARIHAEKLGRISNHLMHVTVTLAIEGERHAAEIIAKTRGKGELVAKSISHDMYASIDQVISKVEKQLQKVEARYRERRNGSKENRFGDTPKSKESSSRNSAASEGD